MHAPNTKTVLKGLLIAACTAGGVLLVSSCVSTDQAVVAPPQIAGAHYVGSKACAECHSNITSHFAGATHANLMIAGSNGQHMGCESCHGPGSLHVQSGGGPGTIINPGKSPQVCFQCHLDKRAQFNLPYTHPVLSGHMGCIDCHDPHQGSAVPTGGTQLATSVNQTCIKCHAEQAGPFVFEHEAVRQGCTTCHDPHGSVNPKMLRVRNQNLCLQCHFQQQTASGAILIGNRDHSSFLSRGTCWSAGCHEAVHGSNVSTSLRF